MAGYILGIETSCDETAAAVVRDGRQVLSNIISSQAELHRHYGGVVPEIASRRHVELILPVVDQALQTAGVNLSDLQAVAVTAGPGLVGALLVGVSAAKGLAWAAGLPLVGVNHLEGHIYANFLAEEQPELPALCLVVSGGHTDLIYLPEHGSPHILGRTRDDAAGEAFDKGARTLGLGYPGGPAIDALARGGDPAAFAFPRARLGDDSLDFSFSGLKTALLLEVEARRRAGDLADRLPDLAAAYQEAIVSVLVDKALRAVREYQVKCLLLAGGVAANSALRRQMQVAAGRAGIPLFYPPPILCTDNAAMIACAAHYYLLAGQVAGWDLNAFPSLPLGKRPQGPSLEERIC